MGFVTVDGADYLMNLFSSNETSADNYYLALIIGASPGIAASGDELEEPFYDDYSRAQINNIFGSWEVFSGTLSNSVEILFPSPGSSWGTVRYWALTDAPAQGRVLFVGDLEQFEVTIGEDVFLAPGALSLGLDIPGWKETI